MHIRTTQGLALLPVIAIGCLVWSVIAFYKGSVSVETAIITVIGGLAGAISAWTRFAPRTRENLLSFLLWTTLVMAASVIFHSALESFKDVFSWRQMLLNAFISYLFVLLLKLCAIFLDKISA